MARIFIDTNILLYAVSTRDADAHKAAIARKILSSEDWAWSAQVAAEFARASRSPRQTSPLTSTQARQWLELWMPFPMVAIDGPLILEALAISERFRLSQFDAQILAAAIRFECPVVYSEDLNHNQSYGPVRVINPFK